MEAFIQNFAKLDIDVNAEDRNGKTAFHQACKYGRSKITEILIQNSALLKMNVNATEDVNYQTAAHLACGLGQSEIVKILLQNSTEYNIDLNARALGHRCCGRDPRGSEPTSHPS